MNGDKETEVRRRTVLYNAINKLIKEQGKAPFLMYCTQGKEKLFDNVPCVPRFRVSKNYRLNNYLNGKVIAQFDASAEIISFEEQGDDDFGCNPWFYETDTLDENDLLKRSCLSNDELDRYLNAGDGTAIHVKPGTMKTVGFPKNLSDYGIKKAPQSFMYVEVDE